MMRQYKEIKSKHEDCILFFRLGDFYEMFFDDAKVASEELDLALTGKDCGLEERAPMCGVPYHSCEAYIGRLIQKGYHVAICEQTEDPAAAKGLVKRDIVRVITPGTVIEDSMLNESENNYLAAVYIDKNRAGLCFVDASTGYVCGTELNSDEIGQKIVSELGRYRPKELIINQKNKEVADFCSRTDCALTKSAADCFDSETPVLDLRIRLRAENLKKIGLPESSAAVFAVAAALKYLSRTQMSGLERVRRVDIYEEHQYMHLDMTAIRNLELVASMRGGEKKGSLLGVLDKTRTSLGRRMIRKWVEAPLMNEASIHNRHDAVEELADNPVFLAEMRESLSGIADIERLMTRIVYGTAGGRELRSLANTIERLPGLKQVLSCLDSTLLRRLENSLDTLDDVYKLINESIVDEPPVTVREGGVIRPEYNEELSLLCNDYSSGKNFITKIEEKEKELTGIKNLRVRYNKVFGYYIEVSNSNKDKIPDRYIRKQTLVNCERYITDELKDLEARVLGAKERRVTLEYEIFTDIRKKVADQLARIQTTATAVARADVLCSLAYVASLNNYCRPIMNTEGIIKIEGGRHPVVEQMTDSPFVPNDTLLDNGDNRCAIITGPNMAGKSTYMRQVALIVLMAQIGSFVPASHAEIGIADSIFTRIGASDDLMTGRSTFMVEMSEVADILEKATKNSLIILDEIGRGTSTYDGMSIARAVLEYVSAKDKIGAKTLFATHYHELTVLEGELEGVKNYNIAVKKRGDDITFLRRIVRGGADESYGVEVAKLSGIPDDVIKRAKEILSGMENGSGAAALPERAPARFETSGGTQTADRELAEEISRIDVNTLTPIEAMSKLYEIVGKAKESLS